MVKSKELQKIAKIVVPLLKKSGVSRAGIFGSYARGEARRRSDIDILIQPAKKMGFRFAGLELKLSKRLNKKVDLVSYNGLSPYLREKILNEEVRIL
ncbi:MAG: nucleotidyltransferase family protein [Candidatus Woesearchaeota archaeon]